MMHSYIWYHFVLCVPVNRSRDWHYTHELSLIRRGCYIGHDPIIPLYHDTFMNLSPSGPVNLLDPSRTSPMKSSESFPNSGIGLSLYESYSPDHSGYPRDISDPIRDSEQHSVSLLTFHIY